MDVSDPLTSLLYLDPNHFDVLLEFSLEYGFSSIVCFLAETDYRSRLSPGSGSGSGSGLGSSAGSGGSSAISTQQRIYEQYFDALLGIAREAGIAGLKNIPVILSSQLPLPSIFSTICGAVLAKLKEHVRGISPALVIKRLDAAHKDEQRKPELSTVLRSPLYRKYYEAFLNAQQSTGSFADRGSLQCWDAVNKLLISVDRLLIAATSGPSQASPATPSSAEKPQQAMQTTAIRHSATASKGALNAMVISSGGNVVCASASSQVGYTFSDPLEAFSLLLVAMRQIQKTFFSISASSSGSSSSGSSSGSSSSSSVASRSATPTPPEKTTAITSTPSTQPVPVAGISEALRMELASTLNMTSTVRANDIESVDSAFAAVCAGRLVRLLRSVERETFQHLQLQFPDFIKSNEFFTAVAAARVEASPAVAEYLAHTEFLAQLSTAPETLVSWTDSSAGGKTYLCCGDADHYGGGGGGGGGGGSTRTVLLHAVIGANSSGDWSCVSEDVRIWIEEVGVTTSLEEEADRLRLLVMGILEETAYAKSRSGTSAYVDSDANEAALAANDDDDVVCVSHFLPAATSALTRSLWRLAAPDDVQQGGSTNYITLAVTTTQKKGCVCIGIAFYASRCPSTFSWNRLRASSLRASQSEPPKIAIDPTAADVSVPLRSLNKISLLHIYGYHQGLPVSPSATSIQDHYFGPCDVSLSGVVESLSLRCTLQILLLLLTNRSVLLVGHSATALSQIQTALPRLAWPFQLHATHKQVQLLNGKELELWIQLQSKSKSSTHSGAGTGDDFGSSSWIVTCLTSAFEALSSDAQQTLTTLQGTGGKVGSSHTGTLVFDVDACLLVPMAHALPVFSKITDQSMFKKLNSKSFRILQSSCSVGEALLANDVVERAFFRYFVDIFLRHVPQTIYHYPEPGVVSCDVRQLLADLPRFSLSHNNNGGAGTAGADIEVEFVTELVGLSSPSFVELLRLHGLALCSLEA